MTKVNNGDFYSYFFKKKWKTAVAFSSFMCLFYVKHK